MCSLETWCKLATYLVLTLKKLKSTLRSSLKRFDAQPSSGPAIALAMLSALRELVPERLLPRFELNGPSADTQDRRHYRW
jgi:hypothetical protein